METFNREPHGPKSDKLKPFPHQAWTVVTEDAKITKDSYGVKDEKKPILLSQKPLHERLKPYYYFYLIFGLDISGNPNRAFLKLFARYASMGVIICLFICYWMLTFLNLKDSHLEYGATLVCLIVSAMVTSCLITHSIMHNRVKLLLALSKKYDEVNNEIEFTKSDKKMVYVCLGSGLVFLFMYSLFPVKFLPFDENIDWSKRRGENIVRDPTEFSTNTHNYCVAILNNPLVVLCLFMVCMFDLVTLCFFVTYSQRFYGVFRNSHFAKLLNSDEKVDNSIIMHEYRKQHFNISNTVEEVDAVFSPMILIWYVVYTLEMCCWIRAFNTAFFENPFGVALIMLSLAVSFTHFFMLSSGTSTVNDEVTAHLDRVRIMCLKDETANADNLRAVQERIAHLSYVTCVLASPVSVTGWGFFGISKGFVLTISSTVLTFTLVLYGV